MVWSMWIWWPGNFSDRSILSGMGLKQEHMGLARITGSFLSQCSSSLSV
jgi:hypothetical protein